MILFSSPKPFRPDTEAVQRSAIRSWRAAFPEAKIFLFGRGKALAETCREEEVALGGALEDGPQGGEIITSMFRQVSDRFSGQAILYLNSDIFLKPTAQESLQPILERPGPWIASTRRWCLPRFEGGVLGGSQWDSFWEKSSLQGRYGEACALDLFLMRDFPLEKMPPFLIGHQGWDNWLLFHARMRDLPVIDLSPVLQAVHCDHDYAYASQNTRIDRRDGPLEEYNMGLLGKDSHRFHLGHATHELSEEGLRPTTGWAPRLRSFELWRIRHPVHDWWVRILKSMLRPLFRIWERQATIQENWFCRKTMAASDPWPGAA